jgi:cysteine desulfurase
MSRVHLDHNATTPLRPEARAEFLRVADSAAGNPSSVHASGRAARAVLDEARERIAAALGVDCGELIFTSGGTEANNAAIFGVAHPDAPLLVSATEHSSVREAAAAQRAVGRPVRTLATDSEGRLELHDLRAALTCPSAAAQGETPAAPPHAAHEDGSGGMPGTAGETPPGLLSTIGANNELGTLAPFEAIRAALDETPRSARPLWHADCVQMLGKAPLRPRDLGLDLASLSAHKVAGPLGVGVLWCSARAPLSPHLVGGGQEGGLRAGTENVPAIAAAALAIELAVAEQAEYAARTRELSIDLWRGIHAALPAAILLGPDLDSPDRLPNTLCILLPGADGRVLVPRLDLAGLEVSAGSACSSGSIEPSPILLALGHSEDAARAALRLSLGRTTTQAEVRSAVSTMGKTCG